jgi:Cu/Ag efflux pump CusA
MVTGIAYDFHKMEISWISESTQWWSSMASAVIFGLALATVLTLVVVPVLYSLVYTGSRSAGLFVNRIRKAYWSPFYRMTGVSPDDQK